MFCISFDGVKYVASALLYLTLRWLFRNYEKKQVISSNIVAAINLYIYLYTGDLSVIVNYYWYDTTIAILHKDYPILVHHIVTLYAILHCSYCDDYENMIKILYLMKSSDLLFHHYQIIKCLELGHLRIFKLYQICSILYTIISWVWFRFINVILLMPFGTRKTHIIVFMIHLANLWWLTKLYAIVKKLIYF